MNETSAEAHAGPGQPAGEHDRALAARIAKEWDWRQQQVPAHEDSTGPISDTLPDVDNAAQDERARYWSDVLRELEAIPRDALIPDNLDNYDVFKYQVRSLLEHQQFRAFEMPLDSDTTFWSQIADTSRRPFDSPADYERWIGQLYSIPKYFKDQIEQMRAGLRRGFTPSQIAMQGRTQSLAAITDLAAEETTLFAPFLRLPSDLPESVRSHLADRGRAAIQTVVQPAYAELRRFMDQEYIPASRQSTAARDWPDGEAFYAMLIRNYTTTDMTPQDVHDIGLAEVDQLDQELAAKAAETGSSASLPDFLDHLRNDPTLYPTNSRQLLHLAAWVCKVFDGKASQYFGQLPRRRFAVRPVPDEIAPFYTSGRGGPDVYLVNVYDLPHRPLFNLPALTLHEAAPGHSFQMALSLENASLPEFRQHTYISAFGEGWALYCERLGVEMGVYEDTLAHVGMLGYQNWRASRLVVDTGIHALGWTRQRAQRFLKDHTTLPEHEIETEVDRYITNPGQAVSYYVGQLKILELRRECEALLRGRFDIRDFHDAVLRTGSVPLEVLARSVKRALTVGERAE